MFGASKSLVYFVYIARCKTVLLGGAKGDNSAVASTPDCYLIHAIVQDAYEVFH